jgi:exoribonuclease R
MGEPDRETYEAAERLVREAHRRAEQAAQQAATDVPPNGWAIPGQPPQPDWNALFALLETLKGTLPPELARQLADALKELLIAIRAVIDYSIERLTIGRPPEPEVEDIPIR